MKKLSVAALPLCVFLTAMPSQSADLIEGYRDSNARVRTTHVTRLEECMLLRIDYRSPYPSRTDVVNVCYPPLDMTPSGSRGSGGTSQTSTQNFAVQ